MPQEGLLIHAPVGEQVLNSAAEALAKALAWPREGSVLSNIESVVSKIRRENETRNLLPGVAKLSGDPP